MINWKKHGLVAAIMTVAGFCCIESWNRNIPADLRDAVADTVPFDTGIRFIDKSRGDLAEPKAAPAEDGVVDGTKGFSDIFVLAPISGRLISYARERLPSRHKLVIHLDCVKTVFGFPESCGKKSAEAAIAPDGSFQTPALSLRAHFVTQYDVRVQLFHEGSPEPVVNETYLGVDSNNAGDRDKLIRDLKKISVYEIPRMHLEFELKSGGSVEEYIRGPQLKNDLFVVENSYEAGGKAFGSCGRGESGELYHERRPLDQYFVGGDIAYAPGFDAPPSKVYVYLYSAMERLKLIEQACPAASSCRVRINDVDPGPAY